MFNIYIYVYIYNIYIYLYILRCCSICTVIYDVSLSLAGANKLPWILSAAFPYANLIQVQSQSGTGLFAAIFWAIRGAELSCSVFFSV